MRALSTVVFVLVLFGVSVALPHLVRATLGPEADGLSGVLALGWGVLCARVVIWRLERLRARAVAHFRQTRPAGEGKP